MADDEKNDRDKKVTAATSDAPQEEFIAASNVPSIPETEAKKESISPPKEEEAGERRH